MNHQIVLLYGQYHTLRRGRRRRQYSDILRRPYIRSLPYKAFQFDLDEIDNDRVMSKFR